MEDQEVRNVESKKKRDRPHDDSKCQGTDIDPDRRRGGQEVAVVVEDEGWINAGAVVVEKTDDREQECRQSEQHDQDKSQRADLQPRSQRWLQPAPRP